MPRDAETRIERLTVRVPAAFAGDGHRLGRAIERRLAQRPPGPAARDFGTVGVRVRARSGDGLAQSVADAVRSALR
jgi:hypothetical protein